MKFAGFQIRMASHLVVLAGEESKLQSVHHIHVTLFQAEVILHEGTELLQLAGMWHCTLKLMELLREMCVTHIKWFNTSEYMPSCLKEQVKKLHQFYLIQCLPNLKFSTLMTVHVFQPVAAIADILSVHIFQITANIANHQLCPWSLRYIFTMNFLSSEDTTVKIPSPTSQSKMAIYSFFKE